MWVKTNRLIFVLLASWKMSIVAPANITTKEDAIEYLYEFGYLIESDSSPVVGCSQCVHVRQAIQNFQSLHGLKVTGILDKSAFKLMNIPRCGVKDYFMEAYQYFVEEGNATEPPRIPNTSEFPVYDQPDPTSLEDFQATKNTIESPIYDNKKFWHLKNPQNQPIPNGTDSMRRSKRYVTYDKGSWARRHFTYQIAKYSRSGIADSVVDSTIAEAARMWAKVANINFEKKSSGSADIVIRFEKEIHCNGDNFSANANILAHAYYPGTPNAGQIHFNDNKQWTVGSYEGDNLLWTAAHELGHALGLRHSQNENSVMYTECIKGYNPKFRLHNDDIDGIQSLYGTNEHQKLTEECVRAMLDGRQSKAIDIYKYLRTQQADVYETILRRAFDSEPENFVSVVDFISETNIAEQIEGFKILLELMNENNLIYDNADVFTLAHMVKNVWKLAAGQDKNKLEELKFKFPEIVQRFIWDPFVWIEWKCFSFRLDSDYNGITYHRTKNDESSQKWIVEPIPDSGGHYFSFKNNATGRFLFVESYKNSFDEPHLFVKTRANVPEDEIKSASWRLFLRKDKDDGKDFVIIDNEEAEGCLFISTIVFPSTVFSLQHQETKCTKWLIQ